MALNGSVQIPAGQTSASIVVTPVADALMEGSETVIATLTANSAYLVGSPSSASVTIADNAAPFITDNPISLTSPVDGRCAALNTLATDDGGEPSLTYVWATTGTPPAPVSFSVNSTNAAKNTIATFSKSGTYVIQVTATDSSGASATQSVSVTVTATLSTIEVTPGAIQLATAQVQQFTAVAKDQFGTAISPQPALSWTKSSNLLGTLTSTGNFTAGTTASALGSITASSGAITGQASVRVQSSELFYAKINFQSTGSEIPLGYQSDYGEIYGIRGSGLQYGWNTSHSDLTRDRNVSPDQRLDTLCHIHAGANWSIRLPNGTYNVLASIGDASNASAHTLNVQGINYWNALSLAANQFRNVTKQVTVTNGILRIDQGTAADKMTRINYLEISPANPTGGVTVGVEGDPVLQIGTSQPYTITLMGPAANHTISLTNGATFSDGSTTKVQASPSSVSYTIRPSSVAADYSINVNNEPRSTIIGWSVGIDTIPTRTGCPAGIPLGVPKSVRILISGNLAANGQRIAVEVIGTGSESAVVSIVGQRFFDATGVVTIKGETQTGAPGYPNKIRALFNGDPARQVAISDYFYVCNHPVKDIITGKTQFGVPSTYYGSIFVSKQTIDGNGGYKTMDKAIGMELIGPASWNNPPFAPGSTGIIVGDWIFLNQSLFGDKLSMPKHFVKPGPAGSWAVDQGMIFRCLRCYATDLPYQGGYKMSHNVTGGSSSSGTWVIYPVKQPLQTTVNGISFFPGDPRTVGPQQAINP